MLIQNSADGPSTASSRTAISADTPLFLSSRSYSVRLATSEGLGERLNAEHVRKIKQILALLDANEKVVFSRAAASRTFSLEVRASGQIGL